MEIALSKNLHKHSLPIIILGSVIIGLSIALYQTYAREASAAVMQKALVSQFLQIKPAADGLAHLSTASLSPSEKAFPHQPLDQPLGPIADSIGIATPLSFTLQPGRIALSK